MGRNVPEQHFWLGVNDHVAGKLCEEWLFVEYFDLEYMVQIPAAKDVSLAAHNDSIINIVAICNVKQGKSHTSRATWSIVLGSHTTQRCGDVFLSVVYDDVS